MRPSRPAGLVAGFLLVATLSSSSVAFGAHPSAVVGAPHAAPGQCGQPGLPPCPPPNTAAIAIVKTAVPTSLPVGGGPVTYTYTVTNPGTAPLNGVTVSDDKCAKVTFVGGDTNGNGFLDPGETWTYTCTATITATTTNTATASGNDATGGMAAVATLTVTVGNVNPCPPGSTDPACVPPPCPPGATNPNCTPPPPPPAKTTLVYECFDLQGRLDPKALVLLTTKNFGNDTVVVRRSQRMCEPAIKTTTKPPTGALAPVVLPNAEMDLDLMDPRGGKHTVMFDGTMAQMKLPGAVSAYDTEMLQLSLASTMPLRMESPEGSFFDSFFDVFLELETMSPSAGRVGSFFDIFPEIALSRSMALGAREAALHLMPGAPMRFMSDQRGSYMLAPTAPIPLLGSNGQPSGWTIGGGTLTPSPAPVPNQVTTRVLECFALERGADLNDPYSLRTANFGLDSVMVHQASRLCEGALKSRQAVVSAAVPAPAPVVWQCWDIVSAKAFRQTPLYLTTRNFGLDQVVALKPDSLCEEAVKTRVNAAGVPSTTLGQPTGRVLECFTIEAKTRNLPFFLRTRNFGLDTVRVGRGSLMCEPAVKQPLGKFVGN